MTLTAPASVPGFDTLSYARRLKAAGVDEAQAEAHAEAVRDAITEGAATRAGLEAGLATLETRMTVRFIGIAIGIVIANAGAIVAAGVVLVNLLPQAA